MDSETTIYKILLSLTTYSTLLVVRNACVQDFDITELIYFYMCIDSTVRCARLLYYHHLTRNWPDDLVPELIHIALMISVMTNSDKPASKLMAVVICAQVAEALANSIEYYRRRQQLMAFMDHLHEVLPQNVPVHRPLPSGDQ